MQIIAIYKLAGPRASLRRVSFGFRLKFPLVFGVCWLALKMEQLDPNRITVNCLMRQPLNLPSKP